MQPNLTISTNPVKDDYQVVKFTGEFDKAGHSEIREELDALVKEFAAKMLVFDFGSLKFINSEGIGYLMEIHTHLAKQDQKLVIVGLNKHVADIFKTIGVNEIVSIYANLAAFLNK